MGIIMKDGHQYGIGGIERAEDVSYDNTESGMTATDVQGALDELSAGLIHTVGATYVDYGNTSIAANYDNKTYTLNNPYGNNLIFPMIATMPNANWITGGVNSYTTTDTTVSISVSFRNFYGSPVSGHIGFLLIGTE